MLVRKDAIATIGSYCILWHILHLFQYSGFYQWTLHKQQEVFHQPALCKHISTKYLPRNPSKLKFLALILSTHLLCPPTICIWKMISESQLLLEPAMLACLHKTHTLTHTHFHALRLAFSLTQKKNTQSQLVMDWLYSPLQVRKLLAR